MAGPCLASQVPDGAGEEATLGAGDLDDAREDGQDLVAHGTVGRVVVLAT
jgi:hypothetical protein